MDPMKMRRNGQSALSPFVTIAAAFVGLFLIAPILVIGVLSLSSSRFLKFPPPGYSLRWYKALITDDSWRDALLVSLQVATVVMPLATVLGSLAALGLVRRAKRGRELWLSYLLSPMIVPSIVTAVGMFLLYSKANLIESQSGLVLAHTVLAIPLVTLCVLSSLQGVDNSLELCARTLGARPTRAFLTVTLPLILPGILIGAVFSFITSFDELVIAMFITGTKTVTLPKRMWDGIRFEIDPTVSAISILIVVFTSTLVLSIGYISRQLSKNQKKDKYAKSRLEGIASLILQTKSGADSK
jgi:putative spermidine/putrescine transport system permease protein